MTALLSFVQIINFNFLVEHCCHPERSEGTAGLFKLNSKFQRLLFLMAILICNIKQITTVKNINTLKKETQT
jgi:hypothetical protein